jgi:uncharacterized cysteine cluster protein YcgN (CxxCxxCC family)
MTTSIPTVARTSGQCKQVDSSQTKSREYQAMMHEPTSCISVKKESLHQACMFEMLQEHTWQYYILMKNFIKR